MSSTREEIIETTKWLFAERGFENVTLREVASECGISVGNLSYHFKKKEDLVNAMLVDVYSELDESLALSTDGTVAKLFDRFADLEGTSRRLSFYFRNMFALSNEYPVFKENQERFREHLFYYYLRSFVAMIEGGSMRDDIPEKQLRSLAIRTILLTVSWALNTASTSAHELHDTDLFHTLCNSIYPYLSAQGLREWDEYFSDDAAGE